MLVVLAGLSAVALLVAIETLMTLAFDGAISWRSASIAVAVLALATIVAVVASRESAWLAVIGLNVAVALVVTVAWRTRPRRV